MSRCYCEEQASRSRTVPLQLIPGPGFEAASDSVFAVAHVLRCQEARKGSLMLPMPASVERVLLSTGDACRCCCCCCRCCCGNDYALTGSHVPDGASYSCCCWHVF